MHLFVVMIITTTIALQRTLNETVIFMFIAGAVKDSSMRTVLRYWLLGCA